MRSVTDSIKYMHESYKRSDGIKADSLKHCSDMTKVHAMHIPYQNDFCKNLEIIRRRKLEGRDDIPGIGGHFREEESR